jgi:hypothetical protein
MVMADPEPVAKRPLAPEPVVNTVPSVIVTTAADSARTPALRPYLLLSSTDQGQVAAVENVNAGLIGAGRGIGLIRLCRRAAVQSVGPGGICQSSRHDADGQK